MKVSKVMNTAPVTVHPSTTVHTALALLAGNGITTMPVVDSRGRILGVVGEADLLDTDRKKGVVGDVMCHHTVLVHPETDLTDAVKALTSAHVKSLPVVDAADQVVGMVSRSDIIRLLARGDSILQQDIIDAMCAAGLHGWQVAVHHGTVDLCAPRSEASDSDLAGHTAEQVLGVTDVQIR
jgi:CBS-domain-containing membrane protein